MIEKRFFLLHLLKSIEDLNVPYWQSNKNSKLHFRPCANVIKLPVIPKTITGQTKAIVLLQLHSDPCWTGVLFSLNSWTTAPGYFDFNYVNSLSFLCPRFVCLFFKSFIDNNTCSISWLLKCLLRQNDWVPHPLPSYPTV